MKDGITRTDITAAINTFRILESGDIPSTSGPAVYSDDAQDVVLSFLAFLNCKIASMLLQVINPTLHVNPQDVLNLPLPDSKLRSTAAVARELVAAARADWDSFEMSWGFQGLSLIQRGITVQRSQEAADAECHTRFARMKELEEANNRLFIDAYSLQTELSPEVSDDQITLNRPDREEDIKRLLSYAIGCMMGRYSLDKPGLIYAQSGNIGFDPGEYKTFPADEDGIVPLLETDWGIPGDAASRLVEFIGVVWPNERLEENLKFIADSLVPAKDERPRDTIRRYLATGFYKDHLRWYKRRPIYWLFSSGKQRAFQALVYLHRYHEGTLARMRTEYVIPLLGKIAARIEQLEGDKTGATSTSHRRKLEKEQDTLKRQQAELQAYDEKLRHYADLRIKLDLDDGVKVNYGKFGDLLAEVRAVTGGSDE
jgi:hypothetical protein